MKIISKTLNSLFFIGWAKEIGHINWHVLDDGVVMLLEFLEELGVRMSYEVDCNSLSSKSS